MKKVKIIANPSSGRQGIDRRLERIMKLLLDGGYTVNKFETKKKNDAMDETIRACKEDWDILIVSGGDGTVNEVAHGIVLGGRKIPVAILSSGTVNDFSTHMEIPKTPTEFFEMIEEGHTVDVDLGKTGENYFVNVAAGGILTKVAYQVPAEAKLIFGRAAYYVEGLKELATQGIEPISVKIESEEYTNEEEILLFLISNSSSIGGFKKIAPMADVLDGYMDVIIIRDAEIGELANVFIKIFSGEHIKNPNVVYFKTKKISISSASEVPIDIDGEKGSHLPATFEVLNNAFRILV